MLYFSGNNQRLEFLGDSICNFLSAEFLFKHFPLHHEGHLTLLRCTMVGAPTQALVAQQLGMEQYVISRQTLSHEKMGWKQKILADLMEAFIAALFIGKKWR
jgi:ribonuclease-3